MKNSPGDEGSLAKHSYPSRAAYKLRSALDFFRQQHEVKIEERICMDLGSAHGGFVQVLLEEGAKRVYAVDVAYGILDYKLRRDEHVVVLERRNLRNLHRSWLTKEDQEYLEDPLKNPPVEDSIKENLGTPKSRLFLSCDAAFISARTVLEVLRQFREQSKIAIEALLLVKPQFEDSKAAQKGLIEDAALREKLVGSVKQKAKECGFHLLGSTAVHPKGTQGNQEYMLYLI